MDILSMSPGPTKQQSHKWREQGSRESESIPLFTFSHFLFPLNSTSQPPGFLWESLPASESLKGYPIWLPPPKGRPQHGVPGVKPPPMGQTPRERRGTQRRPSLKGKRNMLNV